ncbi:MAG: hypothetical protein AB9915_00410 [Candidatus Dojkabacteria bacterium]
MKKISIFVIAFVCYLFLAALPQESVNVFYSERRGNATAGCWMYLKLPAGFPEEIFLPFSETEGDKLILRMWKDALPYWGLEEEDGFDHFPYQKGEKLLQEFYPLSKKMDWGYKEYRGLYFSVYGEEPNPQGIGTFMALYGMDGRWFSRDYDYIILTFQEVPPIGEAQKFIYTEEWQIHKGDNKLFVLGEEISGKFFGWMRTHWEEECYNGEWPVFNQCDTEAYYFLY